MKRDSDDDGSENPANSEHGFEDEEDSYAEYSDMSGSESKSPADSERSNIDDDWDYHREYLEETCPYDNDYLDFLRTLSDVIDRVEVDQTVLAEYIRISEADRLTIPKKYNREMDVICKIIKRNLDGGKVDRFDAEEETSGVIMQRVDADSADELNDGEKVDRFDAEEETSGGIMQDVDANSSDELNTLMVGMHIHPEKNGFPCLMIDSKDAKIWHASLLFFLMSLIEKNLMSMDLIDAIHEIRMRNICPTVFEPAVQDALIHWTAPVVRHKTAGMHTASYIPLIHFMLCCEFKEPHDYRKDWTVLFHVHKDLNVYEAFPSEMIASLKATYDKIDQGITKILIIFNVNMGSKYGGEGHVLNCLIVRELDQRVFITLLDRLWTRYDHDDYHSHYISRLIEIADNLIPGGKEAYDIVLSDEAERWKSKDIDLLIDGGGHASDFYPGTCFKKHETLGLRWLSYILEQEIFFGVARSDAFTCPFDAALFIVSCLEECSLETDYNLHELIMNVHNVTDILNVELSMCILSGYCVLSPASVQRALSYADPNQSRFHVVDHTVSITSNVYAWALKPQRRKYRTRDPTSAAGNFVETFSLEHDSSYRTGFRWNRCLHRHQGPPQSKNLLLELKEASMNETRVKRLRDSMDYDMAEAGESGECSISQDPKKMNYGSSIVQNLNIINMILTLI